MGILQFGDERTTLALIESTLVIKEQSRKVNSDKTAGNFLEVPRVLLGRLISPGCTRAPYRLK